MPSETKPMNDVFWCTDFYVQSAEDYFNVKNKQVNLVSIQEIVDALNSDDGDSVVGTIA